MPSVPAKPATLPRWATNMGVTTAPTSGKQDTGWTDGEQPSAEVLNWLENLDYQWAQYQSSLGDYATAVEQVIALNAVLQNIAITLPNSPPGGGSICSLSPNSASQSTIISVGTSGHAWFSAGRFDTFGGAVSTGVASTLKSVAANGTLIVAVGAPDSGHPAIVTVAQDQTTSPSWSVRTNPGVAQTLNCVVWSSALNLWCAVGTSGLVLTSPDGTTWTSRAAGATAFVGVVWAASPGLFLAWTAGTSYYTSADGVTWTSRTLPITPLSRVIAGAGLFLVSDSSSKNIYTTPDGITWTARDGALSNPGSTTQAPVVLGFNGKIFIGIIASNCISTSFDGITWKGRSPNDLIGYTASQVVALDNGSFLAYFTGTPAWLTNPFQVP